MLKLWVTTADLRYTPDVAKAYGVFTYLKPVPASDILCQYEFIILMCVLKYLVYGLEEGPVQVSEGCCDVPCVDAQETHWPPAQLSAVCQRSLQRKG